MGKISVIIPTHNRADILPRAIKSIQDQTRPVDEIIVVSDGSTDNTEEVVRKLADKDSRIRLIAYHPGHNGNYARNKGLEAATGEFIAFLDDDDEWLPKKTELQMRIFEREPDVGLVYASQNCIYSDTGITYQTQPMYRGDLSKRIFIRGEMGTPSQVMVRRSVLDQTGPFDLELGALQDYDLFLHQQIRFLQILKNIYMRDYIFGKNTGMRSQSSAKNLKRKSILWWKTGSRNAACATVKRKKPGGMR